MRYLTVGYFLLGMSALLLIFLTNTLVGWSPNYLLPIIRRTEIDSFVIGIQSCGIALSLVGYRKRDMKSEELPFIAVFGIVLFIWGLFTTLLAIGMYEDLLEWSSLPGVRALTIWDLMQGATSVLMGSLWIISGLLSIVTTSIARSYFVSEPTTSDRYYTGLVMLVSGILGILAVFWYVFRFPTYRQFEVLRCFFPFIGGSVTFMFLGLHTMRADK